jgi:hypothetical protein
MSVKKTELKKLVESMKQSGLDVSALEALLEASKVSHKAKAVKKTPEDVKAEKVEVVKTEIQAIKEASLANKQSRERRLKKSLEEKEKTKTLRVTRKK